VTTTPADPARLRIMPLPVAGTRIAYHELGDPAGEPMLCLHGLALSGLVFEAHQEQFVRLGVRAIAPCLIGGMSVPDSRKTITALAGELVELLGLLGVDRFDMAGFSWGTVVELALLVQVPQRIRRAAFLGAMLPARFVEPGEWARLKPDVRLSFAMVRQVPWLHRALMAAMGRLPASALVSQFRDPLLSPPESLALTPGHPFHDHLVRCVDECRRTGSRFLTDGWRMLLDEPGYALADLARAAAGAELRFYVGERDNVHLPSFSQRVVDACEASADGQAPACSATAPAGVFQPLLRRGPCSLWVVPGAGRMACMLYLGDALDHLLTQPAM